MDTAIRLFHLFVLSSIFVNAVPPQACFSKFRWDDCGKPPTPVMYYWKPGSRCEVGIWRGCLPNPNMFTDEYECVNTCIFVTRGSNMDALEVLKQDDNVITDSDDEANVTVSSDHLNGTESLNVTETFDNGTAVNLTTVNVNVTADDNITTTLTANEDAPNEDTPEPVVE